MKISQHFLNCYSQNKFAPAMSAACLHSYSVNKCNLDAQEVYLYRLKNDFLVFSKIMKKIKNSNVFGPECHASVSISCACVI